jgi:hypothetical protein
MLIMLIIMLKSYTYFGVSVNLSVPLHIRAQLFTGNSYEEGLKISPFSAQILEYLNFFWGHFLYLKII